MTTYKPRHFRLEELVPRSVFADLGERAWQMLDPRLLMTLDYLRDMIGKPLIVNNWHQGGKFAQRCLRTDTATGAQYSQHRYGRAADFDAVGVSAEDVRKMIRAVVFSDPKSLPYLTAMELGTSWVHIDVRNHDRDKLGLLTFNP